VRPAATDALPDDECGASRRRMQVMTPEVASNQRCWSSRSAEECKLYRPTPFESDLMTEVTPASMQALLQKLGQDLRSTRSDFAGYSAAMVGHYLRAQPPMAGADSRTEEARRQLRDALEELCGAMDEMEQAAAWSDELLQLLAESAARAPGGPPPQGS
jgi:hypothetical protein